MKRMDPPLQAQLIIQTDKVTLTQILASLPPKDRHTQSGLVPTLVGAVDQRTGEMEDTKIAFSIPIEVAESPEGEYVYIANVTSRHTAYGSNQSYKDPESALLAGIRHYLRYTTYADVPEAWEAYGLTPTSLLTDEERCIIEDILTVFCMFQIETWTTEQLTMKIINQSRDPESQRALTMYPDSAIVKMAEDAIANAEDVREPGMIEKLRSILTNLEHRKTAKLRKLQ